VSGRGGLTVEKDSEFSGLSSSIQVIQTQVYLPIFKARALKCGVYQG